MLSFRDVLSAVPAHDHLLGILGPPKAESQTHRGSSLLLLPRAWDGSSLAVPHFFLRLHHGSPSTAKLGLPPGHAPITSHGQWHR